MAKTPKMSVEQNLQLKGLTNDEKLAMIKSWYDAGQVKTVSYQYFCNLWLNRKNKKILEERKLLAREPHENLGRSKFRTPAEGEIQMLTDKMKGLITTYTANREVNMSYLSPMEVDKFRKYAKEHFRIYRARVNEMLIIGLKFPDPTEVLNKFCNEFIAEFKKGFWTDNEFWWTLWADPKFVPKDAVRLMLVEKDGEYTIDNSFDPQFIKKLIPLIEFQRDKEIDRLQHVEDTMHGKELARERKRKAGRRDAFNLLLEVAEKYSKAI